MKNKLRGLICKADNAMQNEEYVRAFMLMQKIAESKADINCKVDAGKAQNHLLHKRYKEAHYIIHKMYDLTQPEEDRIRPDSK